MFVMKYMRKKKVFMAIAAFALLSACTSNDDIQGGGKQEQGKDYTNTDELVFVDMGTSVLWATMNFGADHSTEFGSYMQWSPLTVSEGDQWAGCRLPSWAEYEELSTVKTSDGKYTDGPCRSTWGKVNGVYGITFTNKKTGNAIFMPAAGYYTEGYDFFVGKIIYNWTLDSETQSQGYLVATTTKFQEGAAPFGGANWELFVDRSTATMRLVKEK